MTTNAIKLLLLDMDGTLTPVKSPWQYVHERIGTWEKVGKPLLKKFLANEISYEKFCEDDARAYQEAGYPLERVLEELNTIPIPPAALEFLEFAVSSGVRPVIISTGFTCTAERFLIALNLNPSAVDIVANTLLEQDGFIMPKLDVIIGHPEKGKAAWAAKVIAKYGVQRDAVGAVGDSDSDKPLFDAAGHYQRVRGPQDLLSIPWFRVD